jgi:hypothetical protein
MRPIPRRPNVWSAQAGNTAMLGRHGINRDVRLVHPAVSLRRYTLPVAASTAFLSAEATRARPATGVMCARLARNRITIRLAATTAQLVPFGLAPLHSSPTRCAACAQMARMLGLGSPVKCAEPMSKVDRVCAAPVPTASSLARVTRSATAAQRDTLA